MEKNKGNVIKAIILYIVYALLMCLIISQKAGLNIDELANFTLSNAYHWFSPEDGVVYTPANEPFVEAMASDGHIDFGHVWQLQIQDGNHPPLYYALNHIFCSVLTPGKISMWPSGILNILIQLLSLFFVRRMLDVFGVDETSKTIMTVGYMFCGGVLSLVAFYRMYTMLMLLVIIFNYLLIKNIGKMTPKVFIELFAVTVIGALTQYYFLFCAFFSSLVFGVILLGEKRFKETIAYVVTMGFSGVVALLIFPEMRWQLMPGGEGGRALNNLADSNTLTQAKIFWRILNQQLFGKLFIILLVVLVVASVYCGLKKHPMMFSKLEWKRYAILMFSSLGVFAIVAKSAFVNSDRYISPIYALVFVSIYTAINRVLKTATGNKVGNVLFAACVLVVTAGSVINADWGYVSPVNEGAEYARNNFADTKALCVWDRPSMANTCMQEVQYCSEAVYYKARNYSEFSDFEVNPDIFSNEIVLFVAMEEQERFKDDFIEKNPQYYVEKSFGHGYSSTYYLKLRN